MVILLFLPTEIYLYILRYTTDKIDLLRLIFFAYSEATEKIIVREKRERGDASVSSSAVYR